MTRTYAAPGKLMLAGEYSVLGPEGQALAIAVDPGVVAEAVPSRYWQLARADLPVSWQEGEPVPEVLRFAWAALQVARGHVEGPLAPHRITTRPQEELLITISDKPGLGSSASATVAICAAVFALAGLDPRQHLEAVLSTALEAHLQAQQGRGSGYDVATIAHGGLVHWSRTTQSATKLTWPERFHLVAGYSGKSALTSKLIQRLEERRLEGDLAVLAETAQDLIDAFVMADLQGIQERISATHKALVMWDQRFDLGIITPQIQSMVRIAHEVGAAAKVSGAGGGDSVIALAADPELLQAVADRWQRDGFSQVAVTPSQDGVKEIEASPQPIDLAQ